ncbi:hypothetical protein HPB48_007759 [Haemaphysalis longicornis]|uniref:Uncharacterized protein n=1 Tax=Haemaphysalis longicornis TaxID=44386 RepID=A0A9J6FZ52_HAELO|nr:hypothetical protein HPB48_007759 [Haemaphysalis longicornis]
MEVISRAPGNASCVSRDPVTSREGHLPLPRTPGNADSSIKDRRVKSIASPEVDTVRTPGQEEGTAEAAPTPSHPSGGPRARNVQTSLTPGALLSAGIAEHGARASPPAQSAAAGVIDPGARASPPTQSVTVGAPASDATTSAPESLIAPVSCCAIEPGEKTRRTLDDYSGRDAFRDPRARSRERRRKGSPNDRDTLLDDQREERRKSRATYHHARRSAGHFMEIEDTDTDSSFASRSPHHSRSPIDRTRVSDYQAEWSARDPSAQDNDERFGLWTIQGPKRRPRFAKKAEPGAPTEEIPRSKLPSYLITLRPRTQDEAEDAARGEDNEHAKELTLPEPATSPAEDGSHAEAVPSEKTDEMIRSQKEAETKDDEHSRGEKVVSEDMGEGADAAPGAVVATSKGSWERTRDNTLSAGSAGSEELPLKPTTQLRRPSTKTRPSVPPERHKVNALPSQLSTTKWGRGVGVHDASGDAFGVRAVLWTEHVEHKQVLGRWQRETAKTKETTTAERSDLYAKAATTPANGKRPE